MLSEDSIVAIIVAVIGSGGFGSLVGWLAQRLARRRESVTREDIRALTRQLEQGDRHFHALDARDADLAGQIRDVKLIVLRQCLFARPRDRNSHESMLQSGEEYVDMGGNGVGHIRLTQLQEEYALRLQSNDWDYTHSAGKPT